MALIRIARYWDGITLYETEAEDIRSAVTEAAKSGANLSHASLSGANLSGASLSDVCLSCANLSCANLSCASLSGADLSGANLSRANLSRADLSYASLSRADLSGADLYGANLSGADLSGANLSCADLSYASLSRADLSGANLSRASLSRADLSGANLSRASLSGADLSGANLSRAIGAQSFACTPLWMLHDQPGAIRAYKLVTAKGIGPFHGGITYAIGKSYEVSDANTDIAEHCGAGISLATLDWCLREWHDGYRVLIAEFTAADIAAIPTTTDGKFRVRRCRIVAEKDISGLIQQQQKQVA
jgi:uncharacterized protein YjbI with pentapeptide repeats